ERVLDWTVLLSCGPFRILEPGHSIDFTIGMVAAPNADSLMSAMARLAMLHYGEHVDLIPNAVAHPDSANYDVGPSGVSGHETCLEPPEGHTFTLDPDCTASVPGAEEMSLVAHPVTIEHGHCVWTNLDCDLCTGLMGKETQIPWLDPGGIPPPPQPRITPTHRTPTP